MRKKKILSIILLIIILATNITTSYAKVFLEDETVNLQKDHTCVSLLKIKGQDMMKTVVYVCYKDPTTNKKYPAFCVQPWVDGVGMGAGDSYDVKLNQISDNVLWRMLYRGYMGTSYREWGLECDDDLYYATKVAVHSMAENISPSDKYEIATRVGKYDQNISLEEVQRRSKKVLEVAQSIYNFGYSGTENYIKGVVTATKNGNLNEETINGKSYIVQKYNISANKTLSSYKVSISGFPNGTKILNSGNNETQNMTETTFKIAIPKTNITTNIIGYINITDAQVKTYPIFYADSKDSNKQNYVIYADPTESSSTRATLNIDANKSNLKIVKKDVENGQAISGVTFEVKYVDGSNIGKFTTDSNGVIQINNLKQGNVTVKELSAPNQYIVNSNSQNATLEYNKTTTLNITNQRKKGSIKLIKYDKDNHSNRLSNVEFKLYNSSGSLVGTYQTSSNGEIIINNIDIGTYTLKETKAKDGYNMANDITFMVEYNKTIEINVDNEKQKGQLSVIKVDEDYRNITIPGVTFEILDDAKNVIETITTNNDGVATTSRLPSYNKKYYIREKSTNKDYILDSRLYEFTLKNNDITNMTLENKHQTGNIKVVKVDKDNNRITMGGIDFELYSEEFGKVIRKYTTDANGEIHIENLRTGKYYLKEITKKNGYYLAKNTYFDVKANQTIEVKIENELEKGQIKILKVDSENENIAIPGVTFQVLDESKKVVETVTTNENGIATTSRLPSYNRTYYLKEIETNENYKLNDEEIQVKLNVDQISNIKIKNDVKKGKIKIIKIDKDYHEIKISNVKFNIIDEKTNKIVDTVITDENGIATSKDLPVTSSYKIKEIETNENYILNQDEIINIVVKDSEYTKISVENEKIKSQVKIVKIDKDYNEIKISGVKFQIINFKGDIVDEFITDENGVAISKRLAVGDYKLKEVATRSEYIINEDLVDIKIEKDRINEYKIENEHKKGNLKIYKVDLDNNKLPVPDVEFEVTDQDGFTYRTKSDQNGNAYIENIRSGMATIKEIKTNKIYKLNTQEYSIEIKHNETSEITIQNEKLKGQIEVFKIDEEDKEYKLEGVEFQVINSNEEVVETIVTNKEGYAITSRIPIGEYKLKETKTDNMHILNEEVVKVDVTVDIVSKLVITNERIKGQIKILKTSEDDNFINGEVAGTPIENVEFEIYDSNQKVVDKITTNADGIAITKPIDKGEYIIKEIKSGEWYLLNDNEFVVSINSHKEVVEVSVTNESEKPSVDIEKTGIIQTTANQEIRYDFKIKNTGNVPLDNFTWYDYLPTGYVQMSKLITGTYNQNLNYSIYYKTNFNDYKLLAADLNTQINNYIDFSNIQLENEEVITEFKMDFGTVDVGFESLSDPYIFVTVNNTVHNDDIFTNNTRLEGYNRTYIVHDEDDHTTKVYEKEINVKKLPRTGY